ncbi:MAG TPA: ribosome-associated translation inhibitor RaiA [Syntrophales bacterium]|mgnify:CR=1 FL=1|jgi:putative sigma-54 modulation protein|nr:ribosome-associated translation inhibitor RaiA [Syntrophales bacterium]
MKITLTFRNTGGEDWFKQVVDERLGKLQKYLDHPAEAHVVLSVEKFRHVAEISLSADGANVIAKEEAKDMNTAIDNAVEKVERQLKRHKEKIRTHKTGAGRSEERVLVVEPVDEDEARGSRVVETRKVVLSPMSLDDAVLEMDSVKNRFLIYRDIATENVRLLYRREDDNYILIETNG